MLEQAIVEGADPNRTPTLSEFACLDVKHNHSILRGFKTFKKRLSQGST